MNVFGGEGVVGDENMDRSCDLLLEVCLGANS